MIDIDAQVLSDLSHGFNLPPKPICQMILRHHDHDYLKQIDEGADQLTFSALKTAKNLVHVNKRFIASPDWPYIKMKYWTH